MPHAQSLCGLVHLNKPYVLHKIAEQLCLISCHNWKASEVAAPVVSLCCMARQRCIDLVFLVLQTLQRSSAARKNPFSAADVKAFFVNTLAPGSSQPASWCLLLGVHTYEYVGYTYIGIYQNEIHL